MPRLLPLAFLLVPTLAAAEPVPVHVTYDRGTIIASDDGGFEVKLTVRNQLRAESTRPTEDGAETSSRFYVPRSRLGFEGRVFGDATRFKVEVALGDRGSFGFLRDVYVERALAARTVWLRAGQWKRPFNRQELVGDFSSEFNERANTAEFAGGGRDLGIAVQSEVERSPDGLEWVVGVFNAFSGGADRPSITTTCTEEQPMTIDCTTSNATNVPADFGPAVVARVGWNHGGIKAYSEGDLERGPLRFAVGAAYKVDLADGGERSHGGQLDAIVKVEGLDVEVGGFAMKLASANKTRFGAMIQGGYFVTPKLQLAARFAVAPTTPARDQLEVRAAINWYWQGHAFKWANDVGVLQQTGEDPTTMASDEPELQLRSMLQLML